MVAVALLEELIKGELQEWQDSRLAVGLEEQIADKIALEGKLYVWQSGGLFDDGSQVLNVHRQDGFGVGFDQPVEFRIVDEVAVEVDTQGEDDDNGTLWFGGSCDQQIDEVTAVLFGDVL